MAREREDAGLFLVALSGFGMFLLVTGIAAALRAVGGAAADTVQAVGLLAACGVVLAGLAARAWGWLR